MLLHPLHILAQQSTADFQEPVREEGTCNSPSNRLSCMMDHVSMKQVWSQLPKNAPRAFSFEENQEMHEINQQEDASLRRGAEGLYSVMWHDIVQVNDF